MTPEQIAACRMMVTEDLAPYTLASWLQTALDAIEAERERCAGIAMAERLCLHCRRHRARRAAVTHSFSVIDPETGKYPDLEHVAMHEPWAKGLIYCDMEGFAIDEGGLLLLMDECGNFRYCPPERFTVIFCGARP